MEIRYTRSLNRNYINFLPDREPAPDSYEMHMLLSGGTDYILPCLLTKFDGCTFLSFDISSCKPVSSLSDRGPLREDFLRRFLASLSDALRSLTDCLLDMARVPLHPDYIYFREEPFVLKLCYLPEGAENPWQSLHSVMQYFLEHLDPSDAGALLLTYRLYRRSSDPAVSPEMLLLESAADFSAPGSLRDDPSQTVSQEFRLQEFRPQEEDPEEDRQGSTFFSETYIPYENSAASSLTDPGLTGFSAADPFLTDPSVTAAPMTDSSLTASTLTAASLMNSSLRNPSLSAASRTNSSLSASSLTFPAPDEPGPRKKLRTALSARRTATLVLFVICTVITAALTFFSITTAFPSGAVPAAACVFGVLSAVLGAAGFLCGRGQRKNRKPESVFPADLPEKPAVSLPESPRKQAAPFSPGASQNREKIYREPASVSCFSFPEASDTEKRGTTVLGSSMNVRAMLVPAPGFWQPAVGLPEKTVILGTQPGKYGLVIRDDTVSRMHAKIHIGEDGYFLEDLNSTNGTFLNETAVLGREKKKLRDGDRVRFAALEYIFCFK